MHVSVKFELYYNTFYGVINLYSFIKSITVYIQLPYFLN